jgi:hypothetical protein
MLHARNRFERSILELSRKHKAEIKQVKENLLTAFGGREQALSKAH